eukprot:4216816-Pyramimonas_sp.AAC.1
MAKALLEEIFMNGGIFAAFRNAGEILTEALRFAEKCDILLDKCTATDVNDECALKVATQELGEKEKELRETCR